MSKFSCYDDRPTPDIVSYLMSTDRDEIDLLAVITVLANRIADLEHKDDEQLN